MKNAINQITGIKNLFAKVYKIGVLVKDSFTI
ncbi:MAG: hypothetical protein ACJA2M_001912 [Polaribacter sp.]|jgi:hypothetical protein